MKTIESNIWYASEERAKSPKKIRVYSDKGILKHTDNGLKFEGEKTAIEIDRKAKVSTARQRLNWMSYIYGGLIFALLDLVIGSGAEMVFGTSWVLTKLYLFMAPLCILCFWWPMKWIVVEYVCDGNPRKAYFSLGGLNGFKALFGGNRALKRQLIAAGLSSGKVH